MRVGRRQDRRVEGASSERSLHSGLGMSARETRIAVAAAMIVLVQGGLSAQQPGICFSGVVRPSCSGFVLFEGTAVASGSSAMTINTITPSTTGNITLVHHIQDLPSYFSGALGYVHVIGTSTAVGPVLELGFSNTSELGNAHRVAVTGRVRRWLGNAVLDLGAGPLGVEVFTPSTSGSCCTDRVRAYGATLETALTYKSLGGITLGADAIHGAGRTSTGLHGGVRVGSYGAVAAAVVTAALGAFVLYGLSHSSD
jgi:hypothetical protein